MSAARGTIRRRLAAMIVGVILMLALPLPTVNLLLPEPITCGMERCLESGECCCDAHWADLRRQGETTIGSQEALTKSGAPGELLINVTLASSPNPRIHVS